jgi:hypothetical protein
MGLSKGPLEEDLYIFFQISSEDSTYSYQDRAFIIHEKASRHCFRFMSAYREGLPAGPLINFAMKKYSGHRCLPSNVIGEITEEYKTKKALADQKKKNFDQLYLHIFK